MTRCGKPTRRPPRRSPIRPRRRKNRRPTPPAPSNSNTRLRRVGVRCNRASAREPTRRETIQGHFTEMSDFHRVRRLPPYVFEQVNQLKAKARAAGADIVDLGMGNPDLPAPKHVIDKLIETVGKPRTDRYSASKGIPGLRRAQAGYYARRFGVKLNPETQVVA